MSFDPDQPDSPRLADALRAAYTHRTPIPPAIDTSILATARQAFEARRRRRMTIRWGTGLAASLAAVLAIAVILHRPSTPVTTIAKAAAKGDLNADGRVDMTDALLLAKHVAANDKPDPAWDANGDGVVDQKDVDALAASAVSLKQPVAVLPRPVLRERAGVRAVAAHQSTVSPLPAFDDLGLDRLHVGSALADIPSNRTFAKANPTEDKMEAPR